MTAGRLLVVIRMLVRRRNEKNHSRFAPPSRANIIAALASRLVAPAARASGIAGAQTVVALARLLAAFGFGALWYAVGPRAALVLVSTVLLLAIPLAAWQLRRVDVVEVGR